MDIGDIVFHDIDIYQMQIALKKKYIIIPTVEGLDSKSDDVTAADVVKSFHKFVINFVRVDMDGDFDSVFTITNKYLKKDENAVIYLMKMSQTSVSYSKTSADESDVFSFNFSTSQLVVDNVVVNDIGIVSAHMQKCVDVLHLFQDDKAELYKK